jgi:hypothetical protein
MHMKAGGPALYVTVFYRTPLSIRKREVFGMAKALSTAVLETPVPTSISEPAAYVSRTPLPRDITSIKISGSIDGRDRLWYADCGGWIASVEPHHVSEVIARKSLMFSNARPKCDELWLLIVNDEFSRAAPASLTQDAAQHRYPSIFDRLLWLEPHSPKVVEFEIARRSRFPKGNREP